MPEVTKQALERYSQQLVATVLDRLCVPFLLLDRSGGVSFANGLAEQVLDDGRHLRRDAEGRIFAATAEGRLAFSQYLPDVSAISPELDLMVAADSDVPPLFVSLSPYAPAPFPGLEPFDPMVVVFIREGDEAEGVAVARQRFGLSEAETDVMREIAAGRSVSDLARRRGVSVHTVRKQLATVLQKVGVSRQSQLALVIDELSGRGRDLGNAAAMARAD